MRYWLLKSEPDCFSIDHLHDRPQQTEAWDGVRNYQARNMLRDDMQPGDLALFYHSNCAAPGVYGLMEVVSRGYPDPTQFDPNHEHFDPTAKPEEPRWYLVDLRYVRHFKKPVLLETLKNQTEALAGCALIARGNRLSVMPIRDEHWQHILSLEE